MKLQIERPAYEKKWQKEWQKSHLFVVKDEKIAGTPKEKLCYILDMFPYPSALGLHVGHPEGYTASDIYSRYLRMNGFTVLHPMGFDAFGLPAENYAIKTGTHPAETTKKNIENMRRQIESLGFSYDWSREVTTTDPEYYKWTQWIFLKLFEHGLVYETFAPINWCPKDKTGLANEEVVNGKCERCGTQVEKKNIKQWLVKITDPKYIDRLEKDLDNVDWPENIKSLQRNWIGKSEGAEVDFLVEGTKEKITVFTTRPDTLFGATYVVLSPEHALVEKLTTAEQKTEIEKYKKKASQKSDLDRTELNKEKTGVFTGAYAINPVNEKKIPIWIADYVLNTYGTGAIMAVPGHDERDFSFAKKFKLPIIQVVKPKRVMPRTTVSTESAATWGVQDADIEYDCWLGDGLMINSEKYNDKKNTEASKEITQWLEKEKKGKRAVNYKLRDWVFSRQRYWGEPIPIVHCENCKREAESTTWVLNFYEQPWNAIRAREKKVETRALNPDEPNRYFANIKSGDIIKGVLKGTDKFIFMRVTKKHLFKNLKAFYEAKDLVHQLRKDFNPTFAEFETFYQLTPDYVDRINTNGLVAWEIEYLQPGCVPVPEKELPLELPKVKKYEPTGTGESPLASIEEWVNVKCPKCGKAAKRETNTMPQWAGSNWYFLRYTDPHNTKQLASPEKIKQWMPVDMYVGGAEHAVLHLLYARFIYKFLYDIGVVPKECGDEPFAALKNQGLILGEDNQKMSKSKGNVVNPDEIIETFGADCMRLYEMFMGPFEDPKPWNTNGLVGVKRFLQRVRDIVNHQGYKLISGNVEADISRQLDVGLNQTINKVSQDIINFRFNTAISELMIFSRNAWDGRTFFSDDQKKKLLIILSPFAPHLTEELWHELGHTTSIHLEQWPLVDKTKLQKATFILPVMINGKKRDDFEMPIDATENDVKKAVHNREKIQKWIEGKTIMKEMYIPKKIYSIVVKE